MEVPLHRQACEVAFGDTDASGWMHFPNIFLYVEAGRARVFAIARDPGV